LVHQIDGLEEAHGWKLFWRAGNVRASSLFSQRSTRVEGQMMTDSPLTLEQIGQLDGAFDRVLVETDRLAKTPLVAAAVATVSGCDIGRTSSRGRP